MKRHLKLSCTILGIVMFLIGCTNNKSAVPKVAVSKIAVSNSSNSNTDKTSTETAETAKSNSNTEANFISHAKTEVVKDVGIPVLMYHSIGYEKDNPVRLPVENLEKQMKYLKDNNYTTLSMEELYNYFENNKAIPKKSIVLTFDDGYLDNYTKLYPVLKKYGFKGTIFVITNAIDKGKDYLLSNQLKELDKNCLAIESHTAGHENLSELPYDKQLKTLKSSKEYLERTLNREVNYIAYPFGKYNQETLRAAKNAGYKMAFTTAGKWSDKSDGILTLDRVYISGFFDLDTFIRRVTNPDYY
ncbi:polysaccharide deacetylase family protein [Clostridium sp. ZS2-4]|uniref:polysaccharide deacetylase family protein n=1 Tax=Clostridium sp. ZS2-4 TaxID=2987703 RepID=UPI00227BF637|nr:polysaccharide deacetylase family protein [Clostridium sp. ZS2-4]MCY6355134.1 polysaccharide deacetylase family protein [Clostridium sp. ZS2-4]